MLYAWVAVEVLDPLSTVPVVVLAAPVDGAGVGVVAAGVGECRGGGNCRRSGRLPESVRWVTGSAFETVTVAVEETGGLTPSSAVSLTV